MKKKLIKACCFAVVLLCVLTGLNNVFKFKYGDGIYSLKMFYKLPRNTADVVVLGSSHAFENINPAILYKDYGITAYDLCGSVQQMWNTYYYLKEALKTQSPKLVILEAFGTTSDLKYSDDSRIIKNTYGMKWSKDKIDAMKVSTPKSKETDFLIGPIQYHSRYRELEKADFVPYMDNKGLFKYWKGFGCNMETQPQERKDVSHVNTPVELNRKTETYYRKTIELAQSHNIPVLVVVSPYSGINDYQQGKYLKAEQIANEYKVPFINFNALYDQMGLNFQTDFADEDHLNYIGNKKYTQYLGSYIKQNYSLPDRRKNGAYTSWEKNLKYYEESLDGVKMKQYTTMAEYTANIPDDDCITIITVTDLNQWNNLAPALQEQLPDGSDAFPHVLVKSPGGIIYSDNSDEVSWHKTVNDVDFAVTGSKAIDPAGKQYTRYLTNIGLTQYQKVSNGVNIVIYNTFTNEVVDAVGFDADHGGVLTR